MTVELRRRPQVQRICIPSWRIPSQFLLSEWAVNIQWDSYVGHYPMLAYFAVEENESIGRERYNFMQEDLNYLWKLGAGSIVGAAAIKYGSVLFPEITRPNLLEAIIIISSPVIVAVLLLIRQSRLQQ